MTPKRPATPSEPSEGINARPEGGSGFCKAVATRQSPCLQTVSNADPDPTAATPYPWTVERGGDLFVPWGEYPHQVGLQVFDRAAAEALVSSWNGLASRVRRWLFGVPVYVGHPDAPSAGPGADTRAYGWVTSLEIEPAGLRMRVRWSDSGARLLNEAHYRYHSPHWLLEQIDGRRGAWRPVRLVSVGLTNWPNMLMPAIANETNQEPAPMEALLKTLAAIFGLDPETATEDAVVAAAKAAAKGDEPAPADNQTVSTTANVTIVAPDPAPEIAELRARVAELEAQLAAANEQAAGARGRLLDAALGELVAAGRGAPADLGALRAEIAALNETDARARLETLAAAPPVANTAALDLGPRKAANTAAAATSPEDRARRRSELMTAEMSRNGGRADLAFVALALKHPELFASRGAPSA